MQVTQHRKPQIIHTIKQIKVRNIKPNRLQSIVRLKLVNHSTYGEHEVMKMSASNRPNRMKKLLASIVKRWINGKAVKNIEQKTTKSLWMMEMKVQVCVRVFVFVSMQSHWWLAVYFGCLRTTTTTSNEALNIQKLARTDNIIFVTSSVIIHYSYRSKERVGDNIFIVASRLNNQIVWMNVIDRWWEPESGISLSV